MKIAEGRWKRSIRNKIGKVWPRNRLQVDSSTFGFTIIRRCRVNQRHGIVLHETPQSVVDDVGNMKHLWIKLLCHLTGHIPHFYKRGLQVGNRVGTWTSCTRCGVLYEESFEIIQSETGEKSCS